MIIAGYSHPVSFKLLLEWVIDLFKFGIWWNHNRSTYLFNNQWFANSRTFNSGVSTQLMYCAWVVGHKYARLQNQHAFWDGCGSHSNRRNEQLFFTWCMKTTEGQSRPTRKTDATYWLWSKITFRLTTPFLGDLATNFYSGNSWLEMKALKRVQAFNFLHVRKF